MLTVALVGLANVAGQEAPSHGGFRALSGSEANSFTVPPDMRPVASIDLEPEGLTYERYQQYLGAAQVLGAQITLYRDSSGVVRAVIGSHYPDIAASNRVALPEAAVRQIVERDIGGAAERTVDLMIDPDSGRHFFRVESRSFASRWFHWIDTASGEVLRRYNAVETGEGIGVRGDTKELTGLTTFHDTAGHGPSGPHYDLISTDDRQLTFDYRNKNPFIYDVTDDDDVWDLVTSDRQSPGHPALIDAHYYANLTDDYLQNVHGLDWIADCGYTAMQSVAHYNRNYSNAFWNGTYVVYGDGDGIDWRELSGGLDIVAHEHGHGVTDCTSDLIYQDEPGALNESFSDIIGNSVEFFANEPDSSNCVKADGQTTCGDWWIGEDIDLRADVVPGFRNMADPEEDADPDHYSEYIVTTADSGGVHSNSAIPNHANYLLVNGGLNASCAEPLTHNSAHCSDGDTQDNNLNVTGIGLADAQSVFFLGFTGLPTNATICDARGATEAVASALFGPSSQQAQSTTDAWLAVGLTELACNNAEASPTPTPAPDADGDGVPDSEDNCPAWPNTDQSLPLWPVPADDPDCDGFTTGDEGFIGTDANSACGVAAWPPDFNDSNDVDVFDVNILKPAFFSTPPGPPYDVRLDLLPDSSIDIFDVNLIKQVFFLSCTP